MGKKERKKTLRFCEISFSSSIYFSFPHGFSDFSLKCFQVLKSLTVTYSRSFIPVMSLFNVTQMSKVRLRFKQVHNLELCQMSRINEVEGPPVEYIHCVFPQIDLHCALPVKTSMLLILYYRCARTSQSTLSFCAVLVNMPLKSLDNHKLASRAIVQLM